jgi:hypothetical protein
MQLVQVERDDAMFVTGYEHHTWRCSGCGQSERRLVFNRPDKPPAPEHNQDPKPPAEPKKPASWAEVVDKLRDRQRQLAEDAAGGRGRPTPRKRTQSPAKSVPPWSPGKVKPVTAQPGRTAPTQAPAGTLARLAEKLRNRQKGTPSPPDAPTVVQSREFDEVWDGLAGPEKRPEPSPALPPLAPLPRSVSLVVLESKLTEAASATARALALLSGRRFRSRKG